jgi:16S rRNA (uracil1498-N3)-methyltransferase
MRIPRVFHPEARAGKKLVADEPDFRHLIAVLRRGPGDAVEVCDGQGGIFSARIESIDPAQRLVRIEVLAPRAAEPAPPPLLALRVAAAVPRGDGFELALRAASETGLAEILPLITERTVARPEGSSQKVERWRRIARESASQCLRAAPIEVADPLPWREFLAALPAPAAGGAEDPPAWICLPGAPAPAAAGLVAALARGGPVTVVVGPEGGFSPRELGQASAAGLRAVGFPTPVLRTPTAMVYLGALGALAAEEGAAAQTGD